MAEQEQAPKRIRRTAAEIEAARAAGLEAPKRTDKASTGSKGKAKLTLAGIKRGVGMALTFGDMLLAKVAPAIWQPEDCLSPVETGLLSEAVAGEIAHYPKAVEWLSRVGQASQHAQLVYALAVISAPRLARRGIIPQEVSDGLLASTVSVVAGSTYGPDRPNGNGEDNARSVAAGV